MLDRPFWRADRGVTGAAREHLGATVSDGDGRVVDADVDAEIRLGAGIEVEQRRWAPARRLADARFHDDTVGDQLVDDPRDRRLGQERPLRDLGPGHGSGPAEEVEDDGAVVPAHHLTVDLGGACHQGRNLVRSPNKGGAPTPATNAKRWRMSDRYVPSPDDHFTFGLWTVGNPGRDPFGHEVRPPLDPVDSVRHLAEVGAYGVSFHDDDLVPPGSSAAEREGIVKRFRRALDETGLKVPMATCNLFSQPVFRSGAFTANDVNVRRFAVAKTLDAIDLGVELGAQVFVMWGGREGCEVDAAMDVRAALDRYAEAINLACAVRHQPWLRPAVCARAQAERTARRHPAAYGRAHARVHRRARVPRHGRGEPRVRARDDVGPVVPPRGRAGAVAREAVPHRPQRARGPGKYDQDFRFGSEGIRDAFYLVKLLEDAGYDGMRHFDAHPYRTEDEAGVWDFARGCIRTYLILREKAQRFHEDPEIQAALEVAKVSELAVPTLPEGGIEGLRGMFQTRSSWRSEVSVSSVSTSWSTSSSSESANAGGGRGRQSSAAE